MKISRYTYKKNIILIFFVIFILCGCGNTDKINKERDKLIGTLNDKNLYLKNYKDFFILNKFGDNNQEDKRIKIKKFVLEKTIKEKILKEKNLFFVDNKKINEQLTTLKSKSGENYLYEAEKNLNYIFNNQEDLIDLLEYSNAYDNYLKSKIDVTNDMISKEYYDKHKTLYSSMHILTETEEQCNTILTKIKNNEKTFEDLVQESKKIKKARDEENKKNSDNNNSDNKNEELFLENFTLLGVPIKQLCDLGTKPDTEFVAEFKNVLSKMNPNEISQNPIKTEFGYHIIKVNDVKKNELDGKLQEKIKNKIINNKLSDEKLIAKIDKELLDKININITDDNLKPMFEDYKKELDDKINKN